MIPIFRWHRIITTILPPEGDRKDREVRVLSDRYASEWFVDWHAAELAGEHGAETSALRLAADHYPELVEHGDELARVAATRWPLTTAQRNGDEFYLYSATFSISRSPIRLHIEVHVEVAKLSGLPSLDTVQADLLVLTTALDNARKRLSNPDAVHLLLPPESP